MFSHKPKIWFISQFIFWKIFGCSCKRTQLTKTLVTQSTKGWTVLHLQCIENYLSFTIDITKVTNFYFLAKLFNDDYIKFLNFQIIIHWSRRTLTTHTKERGIFSVFEKKKLSEKKIKANIIVSRTTLCTQNIKFCMQNFFFRKMFVCVRKSICSWKKKNQKNFWAKFSNLLQKFFVSPSKKCQSYNFHILEYCMISIFFKKRKPQFFSTRLFY